MEIKKLRDNPRAFEVLFAEKTSTKAIVYECLSQDNMSEIIAKITFLKVLSNFCKDFFRKTKRNRFH
jgi:hypothetical protein